MLLRGLLLLGGVGGALWSATALPSIQVAVPARDTTEKIISDQRFKAGTLATIRTRIEGVSSSIVQPDILRADALITLTIAEQAVQRKTSAEADREIEQALEKVRNSIALIPGDSFLWLMLHSVERARNGLEARTLSYLEQSYITGPIEGWMAARRNRMSLAVFPMLSGEMQPRVLAEFAAMVESGLIEAAAINLSSAGWPYRDQLLASLEHVDVVARKRLSMVLARDAIKVSIPGIPADDRPWFR